ncbi:type II toxin-antitoxin system prevent-host-death family antitoxin [Leptolyngbya sp. DQ-M1]|uniref:type II toxin-antitoxin system Phd/YefM family antitoxin n=1 Tax=Leptolyngbya sp. DQ-M1 TaxID=2933920 RepID=UPI0032988A34
MITHVTLPEATANIAQLLDRVIQGEEIIISQDGKAIAHISPANSTSETNQQRVPRLPGQYAGRLIVPDNFNDPLPDDILESFLNPTEP